MSTDTKTLPSNHRTRLHWSEIRESGTLAGLRLLWWVHRTGGRRTVSLCLYPVVLYFLAVHRTARRSARQYLRQHYQSYPTQWRKPPGLLAVARMFREFSESVVDKLLSWHLKLDPSQFELRDPAAVARLMEDERGQLIIGSHFGNLEYCRGFMYGFAPKVINILVYERYSANYVEMMRRMNPASRCNVFQVDEFDIATLLLLREKIERGEWVFIAGDRTPVSGEQRTVRVDFLGRPARLPIGPYLLAHSLQCPVKLMFSYKNYGGSDAAFHFEVIDFSERINLPRKAREAQLQALAQRYAEALQRACREAPYQWFNFYDYWPQDDRLEDSPS